MQTNVIIAVLIIVAFGGYALALGYYYACRSWEKAFKENTKMWEDAMRKQRQDYTEAWKKFTR